jgi:hypothetical protein
MRSACPISFDLCADAGLLLALFDVRRSTLFCSDRSNSGERAFETALLTAWNHRVTIIRLTKRSGILGRQALFCLDASCPDHLAPLLGILDDELSEIGG